jgi:hypothetical protein
MIGRKTANNHVKKSLKSGVMGDYHWKTAKIMGYI